MRIAEVSDRSGFSPATLRYYEQVDLLPPPERTAAGYRAYDESVLARLAFIARAKQLGCTLDEVADLMPAWDSGRCPPVQDGLRQLATGKLADARSRAAELAAFTGDLERILAALGAHRPDGPCDANCGCVGEPASAAACTLEPAELPGRVQDWKDFNGHVVARTSIEGGVRLHLDETTPLDELAQLMKAEQGCCAFFSFALTVDSRGVALEVRAPVEGLAAVEALFG